MHLITCAKFMAYHQKDNNNTSLLWNVLSINKSSRHLISHFELDSYKVKCPVSVCRMRLRCHTHTHVMSFRHGYKTNMVMLYTSVYLFTNSWICGSSRDHSFTAKCQPSVMMSFLAR